MSCSESEISTQIAGNPDPSIRMTLDNTATVGHADLECMHHVRCAVAGSPAGSTRRDDVGRSAGAAWRFRHADREDLVVESNNLCERLAPIEIAASRLAFSCGAEERIDGEVDLRFVRKIARRQPLVHGVFGRVEGSTEFSQAANPHNEHAPSVLVEVLAKRR
jgi:hypothetical protein